MNEAEKGHVVRKNANNNIILNYFQDRHFKPRSLEFSFIIYIMLNSNDSLEMAVLMYDCIMRVRVISDFQNSHVRMKKQKKKKAKEAIDRAAGSQVNSAGKSATGAQPERQTGCTPKPQDAASTGTSTKNPERSVGINTKEGRAPSLTAIISGDFDPKREGQDIIRGGADNG
jgi:hypothetical protein